MRIFIKRLSVGILLYLLIMISLIIFQKAKNHQYEKSLLGGISQRTGVQPDWDSVRNYVMCTILVPGKTHEDIKLELQEIGEYNWIGSVDDTNPQIEFTDRVIFEQLPPIGIMFDDHWRFISRRGLENSIWDPVNCE